MEKQAERWKALTVRLSPRVYSYLSSDSTKDGAEYNNVASLVRAIINDFYGVGDMFTLDMIREEAGD